jgi:hypothetical protein
LINSRNSPEEVAALLFHNNWLPHYLKGLPGIKVDLKRCEAIAEQGEEVR